MSSDFSIKPVEAPAATAMTQPASPAADDAVATELPAHTSVPAAEASLRARHDDTQSASDGVSHQVIIDRDAASIVYQVVDNRTSLVIKQFPDQAILRRRAYFRALDLMKDNARIRFTDRSA